MVDVEELAKIAVDCGYKLHQGLGPGLFESVDEALMYESLVKRGLSVERQRSIPIIFDGMKID
jgi:GxxExxY protein